jgi:hypothetical protein
MHVPLCDDYTAFPPLKAAPHAPAALLEVLRPRVDGVQIRRLGLAPVGDEAPLHGMHYERGLSWLGATDDRCMCAGSDVVAGHKVISVYPLVYAECRISIELLDLVWLITFKIPRRI